ncbi:DsbA family protein [Bradyrhizobium sp. NAS96.2]|uniref:DsbA family protein n=1 Tax=Bradyrhizobium sp. NAS96.2 TaxID=1680160 RepID=UPI00093D2E56|nr:DsbA family protein [Bradyrhizobium sp. NAS96.2]OKO73346.1 DSBA oxidoreductase [Bradyrhizobium sp. NAS96.2]
MNHLTKSPLDNAGATRRDALGLIGAGIALLAASGARAEDDKVLTEEQVLRDPDIPVIGNPKGDITIVEWFDYNCPYCRKLAPELRQVVQDDGKVRLVLKDWPILGPVSKVAARMALAAKYQGKFDTAHEAMISVNSRITEPRIAELLSGAGLDMDKLKKDLDANAKAIDAILARNDEQAQAFGFNGTPSFIVGKYRVPGVLSMDQFEQVIADARKANMGRKTEQN